MKKCKRFPVPRAYFVSTVRERAMHPPAASAAEQAHGLALIEDHLDHVFAPLVGTVPFERRCELRAELRDRLYALTAEYIAAGCSPEKAAKKAIEGIDSGASPPRQKSIGKWWSRMLFGDETVPIPTARGAFYTALGWFGAAAALSIMASPFREPLSIWSVLIYPLIAGIATGLRSKERPVLGTLYALLPLAPASYIAADVCGSPGPGLFPLLILIVWLPIGCFASWRAAKLRPAILSALRRHAGQVMPS